MPHKYDQLNEIGMRFVAESARLSGEYGDDQEELEQTTRAVMANMCSIFSSIWGESDLKIAVRVANMIVTSKAAEIKESNQEIVETNKREKYKDLIAG